MNGFIIVSLGGGYSVEGFENMFVLVDHAPGSEMVSLAGCDSIFVATHMAKAYLRHLRGLNRVLGEIEGMQ